MRRMFYNAKKFNQPLGKKFSANGLTTNISNMFEGATAFQNKKKSYNKVFGMTTFHLKIIENDGQPNKKVKKVAVGIIFDSSNILATKEKKWYNRNEEEHFFPLKSDSEIAKINNNKFYIKNGESRLTWVLTSSKQQLIDTWFNKLTEKRDYLINHP